MKEYVLGFVFEKESHASDTPCVLLILKQRPAIQKGKYNGIGGKIEKSDRLPMLAMRREFVEETGIGEFLDFKEYGKIQFEDSLIYLFTAWGDNLEAAQNKEGETEIPTVFPISYLDHFARCGRILENVPVLVCAAYTYLQERDSRKILITYENEKAVS